MRFKTDENIHPEVAEFLRARGHDALTIWDQAMQGQPDDRIAEVCRAEGRVLITTDIGFGDIRVYPPSKSAGIIVLRIAKQSRRAVRSTVGSIVDMLSVEAIAGRLWIVEEHCVRIRSEE